MLSGSFSLFGLSNLFATFLISVLSEFMSVPVLSASLSGLVWSAKFNSTIRRTQMICLHLPIFNFINYLLKLRKKAIEATNINTVINIPSELVSQEFLYSPIIFLLFEIKIMSINNGGASIAFSAAEYTNI